MSNLLVLASCSIIEKKLIKSKTETSSQSNFKIPKEFTKTLITDGKLEKTLVNNINDSSLFFREMRENNSLALDTLLKSKKNNWNSLELRSLGLDFDSLTLVRKENLSLATFYYTKKNVLYTLDKTYFLSIQKNKILAKNIKINQQLLNADIKTYEIDYQYAF